MSGLRAFFSRLRAIVGGARTGNLEDEMQLHSELLAADYRARGMSERDALAAAACALGNSTALREAYREQNGFPMIENLWRDMRFAVKTLRRNPMFAASCAATLAVGLGSMIAVSCVLSTWVWKPLRYPEPDRIVVLSDVDPSGSLWPLSEPGLIDVGTRSKSLTDVSGLRRGTAALTGAGDAETVRTAAVTAPFFTLFGMRPAEGGWFRDSEKKVVISRLLWRRKWLMDPGVVGRSIAVDGESYTIAAVVDPPAEFLAGTDLFIPLAPNAGGSRSARDVEAFARLQTGLSAQQATAELNTIAETGGWRMQTASLAEYVAGPHTGRLLWMIFGAVALFWVMACANVAGLQISRSIARRHEMSTRMALGASRGRLFGQALTESLVLALGGSLLGVGLAALALRAVRHSAGDSFPRLAGLYLDSTTMAIALGSMLVSVVLFTIFSGRPQPFQQGREISRRDRGRDGLVVVQVALASVLLLGAGLLFNSFLRLRAVNPGFDPERILTVHVDLPGRLYNSAHRVAFFRNVNLALARSLQVEAAGATNIAPFSGMATANRFRLEGEPESAGFRAAGWRAVTPGFFTTLGIPLRRGRLFTDADGDGAPEVVIISESMAKQFWPNQNPLGKRLLWGKSGHPKTIVGIVGDLRDIAVDAAPAPTMFRPYAQLSDAPMALVIRTKGDPVTAAGEVRQIVHDVDRNAALELQPLRQTMSDAILRPRASLTAVAVFAAIALLTASFGLYGLIGFRVNQRQQEIGIRLALGSPSDAVRWDVQKRCLRLVLTGLAIGLPLAYILSRLMTQLLYETRPSQVSAYAMVVAAFAVVALAASHGPARRAARMDPAAALRHE